MATTVHPHACGDGVPIGTTIFSTYGSSPRVWGRLSDSKHRLLRRRFIPTRVGTVYYEEPGGLFIYGSSPRVWGR
jgi:hypothetical protein